MIVSREESARGELTVMKRFPLIVRSHSVPLFQLAVPSKQNSSMNKLVVWLFLGFLSRTL
jgi:hypothetical protein